MKKKHIALLIGGLFVSSIAAAQTANVSIYGRLNMDMDIVSKPNSSDLSINKVNSNGSRLGFKGEESLGGGNAAFFLIESNIAGDTGGSTLASREAYLGMKGNWGAVKLGRMYAPYDDLYSIFADNTARNGTITSSTLWGNGATNSYKAGSFDDFMDNSVRYETPTFYGITGMAQYNTAEDTGHSYSAGAGIFYKNAGWNAGVVYQNNQGFRTVDKNDQAISAALSYDFGVVKVAGVYEYLQYEVAAGHDKLTRSLYGAAATVPFGASSLYCFYGYADKGRGTAGDRVGDVVAGSDTGAQQFTISYAYKLSKRTTAYAGYMYIQNDDHANYSYFRTAPRVNGVSSSTPGVDQQGLTIGAVHFF